MKATEMIDSRTQKFMAAESAPPKKAKAKEALKAAQEFEAIFLRMIVKGMRKEATSLTGGGMLGQGLGADVREGWFDSFMADHMAKNGKVGLAEALYRDWVEAGKVDTGEKAQKGSAPEGRENQLHRRLEQVDPKGLDLLQEVRLPRTGGGI